MSFQFNTFSFSSIQLELQYSFEHASIGSSFGLKGSPIIDCNVAFGGEGFSIGAEGAFDSSANTFPKLNGGLGLIKPEFSAALLMYVFFFQYCMVLCVKISL
jgi:hypothetical protein